MKGFHIEHAAIQLFVLEGVGVSVKHDELIHVDSKYIRADSKMNWKGMLEGDDITKQCRAIL